MTRKRYKPEEIVAKLRQVDVLVSQGQGMTEAIRQIGVSEVTYYRWRQEFGGLKIEQVKLAVTSSNITPDRETGIGNWSDSEIKLPPGETSKPRASPCLCRAGASPAACL